MKANQLATLVLRLMGIYCLVLLIPMAELLNSIIYYAQSSSGGVGMTILIITIFLSVGWLAIGISLIVFSRPLGNMLSPLQSDEGRITIVSFEQIQALAFAIAGVLIFAQALPQLLSHVFNLLDYLSQLQKENSSGRMEPPVSRFEFLAAIGTLLKAGLGLGLFFGARGFANFWRSLKSFGTPESPQ